MRTPATGLHPVYQDMAALADAVQAKNLMRFFKTGPGEYGEGDLFIGLKVPQIRMLAKKHAALSDSEIIRLLHDPVHERRMLALFLLVQQMKKADVKKQRHIYDIYLKNTRYINNWDLVDLSAHRIVGPLAPVKTLVSLAKSPLLWDRRIAIIATMHHIYLKKPEPTFTIAELLLHDEEDLLHKATGWMLREVGKRIGRAVEESFLQKHYTAMPRTMLRYAIEHFPQSLRKAYMKK